MLTAVFILVILGLIAWFVSTTPIPAIFKNGIFVLLIIISIVVIANAFGVHLFGNVSLR